MRKTQKYSLIIDTENYAGNFERELTAFVTGHIGECGVGADAADAYIKAGYKPLDFVELRISEDDNVSCSRPTRTYCTPGWFNNGMGGHFLEGQEKEALKHYRKEVKKYYTTQIKAVEISNWPESSKKSSIAGYKKEIDKANKLSKVQKFHACLSVQIYCSRKPTEKEIDFIKQRVSLFNDYRQKEKPNFWNKTPIKITGYRLLVESAAEKTVNI